MCDDGIPAEVGTELATAENMDAPSDTLPDMLAVRVVAKTL